MFFVSIVVAAGLLIWRLVIAPAIIYLSNKKYQEALVASGYDFVMEYDATVVTSARDDHQGRRKRKRTRRRKCIYFNPPYSKTIKTNIGKEFLKIIREEFPKGHPLYPVINKNNIKVSYRCMPNMSQIINSHNRKILRNTVANDVVDVTLTSDDDHNDSDQIKARRRLAATTTIQLLSH